MNRNAEVLNHRQRYATQEEIDWLREMAPSLTNVVILGAGPGIMATALKDGNSRVAILLVDNQTCSYAMAHLADFGPEYAALVTPLVIESTRAGISYAGVPVDLLIVDADHSEEGVRGDIAAWLGHVAPGGRIMFHDYDAAGTWFEGQDQYPGVKRAVEDLLASYERGGRVGTSMIVHTHLTEGL